MAVSTSGEMELAGLVVRLTGDSSSYVRMLAEARRLTMDQSAYIGDQVKKTTQALMNQVQGFGKSEREAMLYQLTMRGATKEQLEFAKALDKQLTQLEKQQKRSRDWEEARKKLEQDLKRLTLVLGGLSTIGLYSMFSAFSNLEEETRRLTASIQMNGKAVEGTLGTYNSFIESMSKVSLSSKTGVTAMLADAEAIGLSNDTSQNAVKIAQALAAAKGGEARSYMQSAISIARGIPDHIQALTGLEKVYDQQVLVNRLNEMLSVGWQKMQEDVKSASGQFQYLRKSIGDLIATMGPVVAEVILPFVQWLQRGVDAISRFSDENKKLIVIFMMIGSAVAALIPVITYLWPVIAAIGGAIASIGTGPLIVIAAIIGSIIALFMEGKIELMSWSDVWDWIKTTAVSTWVTVKKAFLDFVDFVKPLVIQLMHTWSAYLELLISGAVWAYEQVAAVFTTLWGWIKQIWENLIGDTDITWGSIRDTIITTLMVIEFTLRNMGQVAEVAWALFKYVAVASINQVIFLFTDILPTVIIWFFTKLLPMEAKAAVTYIGSLFSILGENIVTLWNNIDWGGMWESFWEATKNIGMRTLDFFKAIPGWIKDKLSSEEVTSIVDSMSEEVKNLKKELKEVPDIIEGIIPGLELPTRVEGELEKRLRKEYEELEATLEGDWETFRKKRMEELFGVPKGMVDEVKKAISDISKHPPHIPKMYWDIVPQIKFDAAAFRGAEFAQRLEKQREELLLMRYRGSPGKLPGEIGVTPGEAVRGFEAGGRSAEWFQRVDKQTETLNMINETLKRIEGKGGIGPAGFGF